MTGFQAASGCDSGVIETFFDAVVLQAVSANLCSDHFSVDGTMTESYASTKSFRPKPDNAGSNEHHDDDSRSSKLSDGRDANSFKPRNPDVNFHGQKRSNETHASATDPETRLFRKGSGKAAELAHPGHALAENRHGLIMDVAVTEANGRGETQAAITMGDRFAQQHGHQPTTMGSDKGYDDGGFHIALESRGILPHGAIRPRLQELKSLNGLFDSHIIWIRIWGAFQIEFHMSPERGLTGSDLPPPIISPVPEPASMALWSVMGGMGLMARRKRKNA